MTGSTCPDCLGPASPGSRVLATMAPFALIALSLSSGSTVIAISSWACPRHGGFGRLAEVPAEHLDRVRFLRGIVSHFHRDEDVEREASVEDATARDGVRMSLLCLPDAARRFPGPGDAVALPDGIYDLRSTAGDRPYVYVEQKNIDETVSPERAQREQWRGWLRLGPAAVLSDLLDAASDEPMPRMAERFRTWLPEQDRYVGDYHADVWALDFFRSVRRTNQVGNDAVAENFLRTWSAASPGEGAVRFAGHLIRPGSGSAEILDAGCGPAVHHPAFTTLGVRWTGLDLSRAMLRTARTHTGTAGLVQGDVAALPFPSRHFAGVWLRAVLVHIARAQLLSVLRECCRVMSDNGVLYLNFQPGRSLALRREGRTFFYHDESDVIRLCRSLGLTVIDRWSDSVSRGSLGDTRVKQWRHLILRGTEDRAIAGGRSEV
jgi:hypothetical protein